jgi:hypothetical protein
MTILLWLAYIFTVLCILIVAGIAGWLIIKFALWCERNL